jgi:hypothetical protein
MIPNLWGAIIFLIMMMYVYLLIVLYIYLTIKTKGNDDQR